ncbi:flavin-containing monooxygenase [Rhabdothermincola salaria]|uniref:flavin-containing monooxygenase n=1 Tax=Rhabdothermincola salaria TaxID=2903142 RepID=UPI001E48E73A|nr:NAD(P)/FAD-dependent oxidoreductase [Rhabdothermincola salaria]MCD9623649.1 NAD(P)/FAD-dependent oxidoreductase [Rhabdothermincola salaria]
MAAEAEGSRPDVHEPGPVTEVDAVVVGAGFAGMYMLWRLRRLGLSAQVIEAAGDVGGTWWWNRYPGARCDIESMDYSYSFDPDLEQEWDWSERYATQPEILAYAGHVADRHDLRRDIRFETRVTGASWDELEGRWLVRTDADDRFRARFLVMAVGCLSAAKEPEIEGIGTFAGPTHHTGRWPHEGVDVSGQRVGVIGTGSSGIQSIPLLAEVAEHLTVFQRTPSYAVPAQNAPLDPEFVAERKANYRAHRETLRTETHGGVVVPPPAGSLAEAAPETRAERLRAGWESGKLFGLLGAFSDVMVDREANAVVAEYAHQRIAEIVEDPEVARRLMPTTYPIGAKRLCLDTDYYATYNRPNVELVDLRETPIEAIVPQGVRTTDRVHELDVLVFATGFDAMTGALLAPEIRGRDGVSLREKWASGPRTYLGLATAGFPNLFMVTGPGSPSVLTNMMVSIEQHVEWISDCIAHLQTAGMATIEADPDAEDAWVEHVNELAGYTLYPEGNSWYLGANVPGKPRVFMPYLGGVAGYRQRCEAVASDGYVGFTLERAGAASDA